MEFCVKTLRWIQLMKMSLIDSIGSLVVTIVVL